jgi:Skp family chaperone for outer membrane proteins
MALKKIFSLMAVLALMAHTAQAEINADNLNLTAEQNQKLTELKENLKAEIEPIWEEIEANRQKITEIEKRYFEEFWNTLSEEQRQIFAKINQ